MHQRYEKGKTIAAVATAPGAGGIAIIRISGDRAFAVGDSIFSGSIHSFDTHTAHFGNIIDLSGEIIDQGMVLIMKNPKSYTGEDTVEIHCHGGIFITQKVLEAAFNAGAHPALPGEFTFKAFQNGKIDLTKAEAVQQIIASKNTLAWQAAEQHLEGKLFDRITFFQKTLTKITAIIEAWVDFPEEGLEFASKEEILSDLYLLIKKMSDLYQTFHDGKILTTSPSLCLIGAPNVGKSSLMNALTEKDRAIVTHIPGTTRDILEEEVQISGLTFRLTDTAGIRDTDELIEKKGIELSKKSANNADLILLVLDTTNPSLIPTNLPQAKTIAIWNKIDLHPPPDCALPFSNPVSISAKTSMGIDRLKKEIYKIMWQNNPPSKEEVLITNQRHFHALGQSIEALTQVVAGLQKDISPEFLVSDMRLALKELGLIIGIDITEEILSSIFSNFCVGK